jgi:hypothetical protein
MIALLKRKVQNYFNELSSIDLFEFNDFVFRNIILKVFKADNILSILIAVSILAISVMIQQSIFIFIPQGSIASFASFILLVLAISITTILLYPLIIIFLVNYFGHRVRGVFRNAFLWVKLVVIIIAFYMCITIISPAWKDLQYRLYMTCVWLLLYFILANLFLAFKHQDSMFKLSKSRLLLFAIFLAMVFPQFVTIFIRTSTMINYTTVNPKIYLSQPSCELLSRSTTKFESANLTINKPEYFKHVADGGCYLYSNAIRYGFASDYTIIFRKNLLPIPGRKDGLYNQYIRLSCYSGNCYAADNINVASDSDIYGDMIKINRDHKTPLDNVNY